MYFDIDLTIVALFLIANLFVGITYGKKVKNIEDYALGGRNFSTGALIATWVATQLTGSGFFVTLDKTYSTGLYYLFAMSFLLCHL